LPDHNRFSFEISIVAIAQFRCRISKRREKVCEVGWRTNVMDKEDSEIVETSIAPPRRKRHFVSLASAMPRLWVMAFTWMPGWTVMTPQST
jgi:hypothetical protein